MFQIKHICTLLFQITTTWRSGSTFLGDILLSHPATFYHYEPLIHFYINQVRDGTPLASEAIKVIKSIFHCDYSDLGMCLLTPMSNLMPNNYAYLILTLNSFKIYRHISRLRKDSLRGIITQRTPLEPVLWRQSQALLQSRLFKSILFTISFSKFENGSIASQSHKIFH